MIVIKTIKKNVYVVLLLSRKMASHLEPLPTHLGPRISSILHTDLFTLTPDQISTFRKAMGLAINRDGSLSIVSFVLKLLKRLSLHNTIIMSTHFLGHKKIHHHLFISDRWRTIKVSLQTYIFLAKSKFRKQGELETARNNRTSPIYLKNRQS